MTTQLHIDNLFRFGKPDMANIAIELIKMTANHRNLSKTRIVQSRYKAEGKSDCVVVSFFIKKGSAYDNASITIYDFSTQAEVNHLMKTVAAFCDGTINLPANS